MDLSRSFSPARVASGLMALLLANSALYPQNLPPGQAVSEAGASAVSLDELRRQIHELSSELHEMRAEVEEARGEASELRHELKNTTEQMLALRNSLSSSLSQNKTQADRPSGPPSSAQPRDLDSRISKVEEEQELLNGKIDDQYQTKVESGSKYRVRLSGMALFNAFTTRGATNNFDLPGFAVRHSIGISNSGIGASLRQSVLGLEVFGPEVAGAKTRADLQADFFGGLTQTPEGVATGIVRLRTAGLRMDWQNTSLVIGQYAPLFSPFSPTSLASIAYPALADAGNLWVWTPQVSVKRRFTFSGGSNLSLEGGVMDPLTGEAPSSLYYRSAQAGERAGQPAYAARVGWGRSPREGDLSVGVGGYYARQNWGSGQMIDAWAGTADWNMPLSHWLSLTGEFYSGHAIGGLGAAEGTSVAYIGPQNGPWTAVRGIASTGGWAQLKFMPIERLEFNGAWGEDFSSASGRQYGSGDSGYQYYDPIGRNMSFSVNGIYRLRSNLMFSRVPALTHFGTST